jgi:hypothetical protein
MPADAMQTTLVERIVACAWRLRRIVTMEGAMFEDNAANGRGLSRAFCYGSAPSEFVQLTRYEGAIERSMYQALQALAILQRTPMASVLPEPETDDEEE